MGKLSLVQRQQLAADRNLGTSYKSLQKNYGCSKVVIKRWAAEGLKAHPNWEDAARSGRPSCLSKAQRKKARASAIRGKTASRIAASLSQQSQQQVSAAAVRRALTVSKCPMYWAPKNRGRRLSEVNKGKRYLFVKKVRSRTFKACLFADSKMFYLYKDGTGSDKYMWHSPSAKPQQVPAGNPMVVHVYACVGKGCKSPLYFVAPTPSMRSKQRKSKENFSSKHFIKAAQQLHSTIKQWGKNNRYHQVVLDHAKQHTSKKSKAALRDMGMFVLDSFPPQSWDLNIIENCWGVLETKLSGMAGRGPTTIKGWRNRITRAWNAIDQATIDKLVASLSERLSAIKDLEGAWLRAKGK